MGCHEVPSWAVRTMYTTMHTLRPRVAHVTVNRLSRACCNCKKIAGDEYDGIFGDSDEEPLEGNVLEVV